MKNIWSKENQQKIIEEHLKENPNCKMCRSPKLYGLSHLFFWILLAFCIFKLLNL